jgi:hypothetical protein
VDSSSRLSMDQDFSVQSRKPPPRPKRLFFADKEHDGAGRRLVQKRVVANVGPRIKRPSGPLQWFGTEFRSRQKYPSRLLIRIRNYHSMPDNRRRAT